MSWKSCKLRCNIAALHNQIYSVLILPSTTLGHLSLGSQRDGAVRLTTLEVPAHGESPAPRGLSDVKVNNGVNVRTYPVEPGDLLNPTG